MHDFALEPEGRDRGGVGEVRTKRSASRDYGIQGRRYDIPCTHHFDIVRAISELGKSEEIDIWSMG